MDTPTRSSLFTRAFSRPERFLAGSFAALILVGTGLLSLPLSQAQPVSLVDSLFTAASAVCVTGLITVDTGTAYTRFGQTVILVLIQVGGLGIMTFAALIIQITGSKLSFRSQAALHDVFYQRNAAARFRRNLHWIILFTLITELLGAALLVGHLRRHGHPDGATYHAIFHAISAFCNAGFSTFSDSLISMRGDPVFMAIMSMLIIVGGLGYSVILELFSRLINRLRGRENPIVWSLNTRVVLATTAGLLLAGAALLSVLGLGHHGVFQSITARTAGFNTVPIGAIPLPALLVLTGLMLVGGSPGSCAGGLKTTTLAIWLARLRARLHQSEDVTIRGRRIPPDLVRRTGLLVAIAAVFNAAGIMVLALCQPEGTALSDLLFEQVSAFATVGLSTGLTASLTLPSKLWIIVSMFIGRLGPLTIALVVMDRRIERVRQPEERLMIG